MKSLILVVISILLNYSVLSAAIIPKLNPCTQANRTKDYRYLNLNSANMETCFKSAMKLLDSGKTKKKGIELMSKFLYLEDDGYRRGAVLQLSNSASVNAINPLLQKGKHAIRVNNGDDLEVIIVSLVALDAHSAARELASYAKSRKNMGMLRTIADEYLVYTRDSNFEKMEQITGPILD